MSELEAAVTVEKAGGRGPRSRKKGILVFLSLLLVLGVGLAIYLRVVVAGYESTDDASIAGSEVVVGAQMLGRITSLAAEEEDRVVGGETLATLDDAALRAQEGEARANEELAAKDVLLAEIKSRQARADLARGSLQLQDHLVSEEQYEHLRMAAQAAQAELDIAQARDRAAEAQLAAVETSLAEATIRSPSGGVVARKWSVVGDIVQPAQAIYTLYDLGRLWVTANFKETQIPHLAVGDRVEITVDAFPGRRFRGRVQDLGAVTASQFALIPAGNASGNYTKVTQRVPVKILFEDELGSAGLADVRLLPGMSAEVRVRTARE